MQLLFIILIFFYSFVCFGQDYEDIRLENFKTIIYKTDTLLLNRSSGILYRINSDRFIRIDKSYDDKIHNYSLDFIHKDTLYRFGGYGYFQANKNLIYFDYSTRQWDLVKFKGFDKINGFYSVGFHFIKDEKLFVVGYDTHESEFQNQRNFKNFGFTYDFKDKEIKKLFEVDKSFVFPNSYYQVDENHVFLFYPNERVLRILETSEFNLYNYNLNQVESSIVNKKNEDFFMEGDLLNFRIKSINRQVFEHQLNFKSVLENMVPVGSLLKKRYTSKWVVLFSVVLILSIVMYLLKKRSKGISTKNNLLCFKGKEIEIDKKMIKIVEEILLKKEVFNWELNEFFDYEKLNYSHINRLKNKIIEEINFKFELVFYQKLILKRRSELDKRITIYYLNPDLDK